MKKLDYLNGLDLLRFFLAISILIVHFPHFDFPFGNEPGAVPIGDLPFNSLLHLIYKYGGFGVEIFWLISGIVFYTIYVDEINSKAISLTSFLFKRFSRLYPLHFLTLCSVAIMQYCYFKNYGNYFIYQNTDAVHFVLNLLMINFWSPKFGLSFNGPFWSVSVEVFVYIVFFVLALGGFLKTSKILVTVFFIFFVFNYLGILSPFYECFCYFFAGCLFVKFYKMINLKLVLSTSVILIGMFVLKYQLLEAKIGFEVNRALSILMKLLIAFVIVAVFSISFKNISTRTEKYLRTMGNLTYATYMIHISLQLIAVLIFSNFSRSFFFNEYFFLGYLFSAIIVGYVLYRFVEKPIQDLLRKLSIK